MGRSGRRHVSPFETPGGSLGLQWERLQEKKPISEIITARQICDLGANLQINEYDRTGK